MQRKHSLLLEVDLRIIREQEMLKNYEMRRTIRQILDELQVEVEAIATQFFMLEMPFES